MSLTLIIPPFLLMEWFVLRDLRRPNAKVRAFRQLADEGFNVFTPMHTRVYEKGGRKIREEVPFIWDLLFVRTERSLLDPVIENIPTLQYRFIKGRGYMQPLTVRDSEMDNFMQVIRAVDSPQYYSPEEILPDMVGKKIRIVSSGLLHGREGHLLKISGSRKKRLFVELSNILAASIEISGIEYIELK